MQNVSSAVDARTLSAFFRNKMRLLPDYVLKKDPALHNKYNLYLDKIQIRWSGCTIYRRRFSLNIKRRLLMKQFNSFYYQVWVPIKKWIDKVVKRNDDDGNQFNHPYIIF